MQKDYESTDRNVADFLLFGLAAFGQLVAAAGIVVNSAGVAVFGGILVLLGILAIGKRDARLE